MNTPSKINHNVKNFLRINFQSKAELVVDKITNSIINGELFDGELMTPENQLCEIFGISRSILREAIRVLVSKGLVEVKQAHGAFIRRPKIDVPKEALRNYLMTNTFSLLQLMEVLTPIELEVARLAAERRDEKYVNTIQKSLQTMSVGINSAGALSNADEAFHQAIIDASGNVLFGIMIPSIGVNLHISRQLSIRHFGIQVVIQEHERIYKTIKNQQPSVAAIKMKNIWIAH